MKKSRSNGSQRNSTRSEGIILPVALDLTSALAIVGNLQVALRHPANNGPAAKIARQVVDSIIEMMLDAGFPALAELAMLGYNPLYDVPVQP